MKNAEKVCHLKIILFINKTHGRIIISEQFLQDKMTIKPVSVGIAGGFFFLILLKF